MAKYFKMALESSPFLEEEVKKAEPTRPVVPKKQSYFIKDVVTKEVKPVRDLETEFLNYLNVVVQLLYSDKKPIPVGQRIFSLRKEDNEKLVDGQNNVLYFKTKNDARIVRDNILKEYHKKVFVTLGPDHSDHT